MHAYTECNHNDSVKFTQNMCSAKNVQSVESYSTGYMGHFTDIQRTRHDEILYACKKGSHRIKKSILNSEFNSLSVSMLPTAGNGLHLAQIRYSAEFGA